MSNLTPQDLERRARWRDTDARKFEQQLKLITLARRKPAKNARDEAEAPAIPRARAKAKSTRDSVGLDHPVPDETAQPKPKKRQRKASGAARKSSVASAAATATLVEIEDGDQKLVDPVMRRAHRPVEDAAYETLVVGRLSASQALIPMPLQESVVQNPAPSASLTPPTAQSAGWITHVVALIGRSVAQLRAHLRGRSRA